MKKKVCLFLRKPIITGWSAGGKYFSIENFYYELFKNNKNKNFTFKFNVCPFESKGFFNRFFLSIWAIFNNTQQNLLENLKKKINKELKGPFFPVHMTISAGFLGEEKELINKMQLTLNKLDKLY